MIPANCLIRARVRACARECAGRIVGMAAPLRHCAAIRTSVGAEKYAVRRRMAASTPARECDRADVAAQRRVGEGAAATRAMRMICAQKRSDRRAFGDRRPRAVSADPPTSAINRLSRPLTCGRLPWPDADLLAAPRCVFPRNLDEHPAQRLHPYRILCVEAADERAIDVP